MFYNCDKCNCLCVLQKKSDIMVCRCTWSFKNEETIGCNKLLFVFEFELNNNLFNSKKIYNIKASSDINFFEFWKIQKKENEDLYKNFIYGKTLFDLWLYVDEIKYDGVIIFTFYKFIFNQEKQSFHLDVNKKKTLTLTLTSIDSLTYDYYVTYISNIIK